MSAAFKRNWKTIVPLCALLWACLLTSFVLHRLRADDEPPSPPPLFPDAGTQSVVHLPGVDQWFQFTFTERTSVTFTTTEASPDTALLLYGPGDSNVLCNASWPDYLTGFRVLAHVGDYALDAGTYYLQVTELAGGMVSVPFAVEYFTGAPTNVPATVTIEPPPATSDPTNAPALAISSTPDVFTHTPGVDQWFQFTLLEPCEVTFTATEASPDTALLLYGPDDATLLINGAWPDFFSGLRVLSQPGANALPAGTYYLSVTDLAGGLVNTPFTVEYSAMPVSSIMPDTNAVILMTPEAPEAGAYTLPVFAGSTNELIEIMPSSEWQFFDYTIGTTQWVFFTLTQRTDLNVYLDQAAPDTTLLLYGPDSVTNLNAVVPADPAAYWRVLDATGGNSLAAGTYLLGVVESTTEPSTNTYPVWFTAAATPESAPEGGGPSESQTAGAPGATATTADVTFVVKQLTLGVPAVDIVCSNRTSGGSIGYKTANTGSLTFKLPVGQNHLVLMGKQQSDGVWSFAGPPEISVSKATTYNYAATFRPHFRVSGTTRDDNSQPLPDVQLDFASVNSLPFIGPSFTSPVKSSVTGAWSNQPFAMNYFYRVTPFKADANWSWQFTPASLTFSSNRTDLNFTGKRVATFMISGTVTEAGTGRRVDGAKITFQNLSFPNGFRPADTVTTNALLTNGGFPVMQSGYWRQSGFATNIGYRITPKVSATNSSGGTWRFTPQYVDVTNTAGPLNFTAEYVENPANLYQLSGRVIDTANSNGVRGVLVHFTAASFGFAFTPQPVFTDANGNWTQTDFQKSNITGQVTYHMAATLNTNYLSGPGGWGGRESLPGNPNPWIISEAIYPTPTGGNIIAGDAMSSKVGRDFLLTRFKYPLDYTLVIASNLSLTASQTTSISNGLRSAANYIYDATDGQVIFRNINIQRQPTGGDAMWRQALIQICPPLLTNRTHVTTIYSTNNGVITTNKQMRLDINDCGASLFSIFVHELGHLEFNLEDEYSVAEKCSHTNHIKGQLVKPGTADTNRFDHSFGHWVMFDSVTNHANLVRSCPKCIMDKLDASEFCTPATHTNVLTSPHKQKGVSCWETMKIRKPFLVIPSGAPLLGPGATGTKFEEPVPGGQSAARHLRVLLP